MTKEELIHKFGETLPTGINMSENHIEIALMWYKMGYKLAVDEAKQWIKNNMAHFWHTDEESIVDKFEKAMEK